ncbi:MAG: peptidoglycan DD-metalloendopeptidase family protein [Chloroflexi bacterium]|nr:peptidoglycan DD-metalloendopeptidase family protein [Chloroflexota bacterium]
MVPAGVTRAVTIVLLVLALAGCAGRALHWDPESYTVREGDTLYSIAFRYGLDYRDLARRNGIGRDYTIYPGQALRLRGEAVAATRASSGTPNTTTRPTTTRTSPLPATAGPTSTPVRSSFEWLWPAAGEVVHGFEGSDSTSKGIDISGRRASDVRATAAGRVVYAGSGLRGYGRLIIVKHDETFISAYAFNRRLLVQEGDEVAAGEQIAEMGQGPDDTPMLHFEIRVDGRAVDPMHYLPDR